MTTEALPIDSEAIRGTFQQWRAAQEPLAAELTESLAALGAYQSHLDAWQQQLAQQREELQAARDQFASERAEFENRQAQCSEEESAELDAARAKIASLSEALLARTEELRALDSSRSQAVTELELIRAREKDLSAKLDELKQSRDLERAQWSEEQRQLREQLDRRAEPANNPRIETAAERPPAERPAVAPAKRPSNSPVLGSLVEQFGKLRQQRSVERSATNKPR